MAKRGYAYQKNEENIARAVGVNLSVSPKQGTEICKYVRGRPLIQAKMLLEQAINEIVPVPFTRFTNGLGHKAGISAGRYHPKACKQILAVLKSAEANAKNKGFNTTDLKVAHIAMQIGPKNMHHGRQRRSIFKNSHIEVVLLEVKGLSVKKKDSSTKKKVLDSEKEEKIVKKPSKKDN
jgi:ribosomal protein uL22